MNPQFPFGTYEGGWNRNAESVEDRLALICDMDRATLTAALAVPGVQPRVVSAINRRLKQFDAWGYEVTIEFHDYSTKKFAISGRNERAVRRVAMLKSCAKRVVEISEPITREAWVRAYGDGKTRM